MRAFLTFFVQNDVIICPVQHMAYSYVSW